MIQLIATLQVLGMQAADYTGSQVDTLRRARDERGSVTIEQVLWAVAVIAIVAVVFAAVKTFVEQKSKDIKSPSGI